MDKEREVHTEKFQERNFVYKIKRNSSNIVLRLRLIILILYFDSLWWHLYKRAEFKQL